MEKLDAETEAKLAKLVKEARDAWLAEQADGFPVMVARAAYLAGRRDGIEAARAVTFDSLCSCGHRIRALTQSPPGDVDTAAPSPVCTVCNDTHVMPVTGFSCTRCPLPCKGCCEPLGAYCRTPMCPCPCHPRKDPGDVTAPVKRLCGNCYGSGRVRVAALFVPCGRCEGTGKEPGDVTDKETP